MLDGDLEDLALGGTVGVLHGDLEDLRLVTWGMFGHGPPCITQKPERQRRVCIRSDSDDRIFATQGVFAP
jgi:hypothetical protein